MTMMMIYDLGPLVEAEAEDAGAGYEEPGDDSETEVDQGCP